jgi:alpha-1,6-mannosyltransferase
MTAQPAHSRRAQNHHHHHHVSRSPAHPPIQRYAPSAWHRDHRYALGCIVAATALTLVIGFLGPSAVTLTLGPRASVLPPYYLPSGILTPNEWVVSMAVVVIILLGAVGLFVGLRAIAGGWQPRVKRLFGLGVVLNLVTILVPPLTSADVLIYAGYGRLYVIGRDPYDITIGEVIRSQFDPVMKWVEQPWYDTPSVYGPIMTTVQFAANKLGGENMHDIVFWLQVAAVLPFIAASAIVVRMARGDPARQARATLLSVANPVLIWAVAAGAHNEALAIMFALLGLQFMRTHPFLAGMGIGLAGCTKLSIGLWGLAMLWAYRRDLKKAALLCLGTIIPMSLAYVVWQPTAFGQVLRNGTYVSVGSWANPPYRLLFLFVGESGAKAILGVIAYAGLVIIAWMLSKVMPWTSAPGLPRGHDPRLDPMTIALRASLILSVAWLTTSMYTLAWYDLLAWMPLALMVASKLDRILLLRITLLSLAFVPGRTVDIGPSLTWVATRLHDTVSPIVQVGVLVAIVMWWRKPDSDVLFPFAFREAKRTPEREEVSRA